ncbi:sulfotransferase [Porticoccaceae bacterium]|nr:sulfotransferase [Porticoccaceae bacterium]
MAINVRQVLRKAQKLVKAGDTDSAEKNYISILSQYPKNKQALEGLTSLKQNLQTPKIHQYKQHLNNLIRLYHEKKFDCVIAEGEQILAGQLHWPRIHSLVAAANLELGNLDAAVGLYSKALELEPNYAEAHNNISIALKKLGQLEEALEHCDQAIALRKDYAEAYNNRGNVLSSLGDTQQALSSFLNAVRIRSGYAEAHNNLGNILRGLGRHKEAISSFKEASRLNPNYAEACSNLANAYDDLGQFDKAISCYKKAIQLDPFFASAYRNLSRHLRYGEDDPLVKQMNGLLGSPNCSNDDLMNIRFALGKANADIGDCAQAFEHFYHGNRLRKTQLGYDISSDQALFASIKELFSHGVAALDVTPTLSDKKPIFVLGMPRSGTTLVEQILASHPLVHGAGELQLMPQLVRSANHGIISNHSDMQSIRDAYLSAVQQLAPDKPYIVDKMPYNFVWIGHILTTLPEAKIVHLKRDAVAVCWSNFKHCFSSAGNGFSYDLEDVARYYRLYEELMLFWHQQFPGRILDFSYEALTNNQADETHRLLEYVELEWDDRCIDFHATERAVATASSRQVRQKLYQGSSEEWRRYETYLRPMINILQEI